MVLFVEDLDKRPDLILQFLRIICSFKDIQGQFAIIVTGDPEPIENALKSMKPVAITGTDKSGTDKLGVNPALRMSMLGEEIEVLSWTTSRQIAFLNRYSIVRPEENDDKTFIDDPTHIWAWYLSEWGKEDDINKIKLKKMHYELTYDFIMNDVVERHFEGIITNFEYAYMSYEEDLKLIGKNKEIFEIGWRAKTKEWENWLKEGKEEDKIDPYHRIIHILRNHLFPKTPLETVVVTNQLIRLYEQWAKTNNYRPVDKWFDPNKSVSRRIRLLVHISWCRWQGNAFGKMMEEFGYGLSSGFQNNVIKVDEESVLKLNSSMKNGVPKNYYDRLRIWCEKIMEEVKKVEPNEKTAMYNVIKLLKELYRSQENLDKSKSIPV